MAKEKDKVLTENRFRKIFKEEFKGAFKPAFQEAFEPYAVAIQNDFNDVKDKIDNLDDRTSDVENSNQRIEQRQIVETKRKDTFSIKIENHEKRITHLEGKPA